LNNRRKLVIALGAGALAAPFGSFAQQQGKVWRIGFVTIRAESGPNEEIFRQGLRDAGFVEGQNIAIEWRFGAGNPDRYREIAAEFVRLKADCIVAWGTDPSLAARLATQTIPIVMVNAADDPVRRGLVASLARPGGNVTGFVSLNSELGGKRLRLLKEILPTASRMAIIWDRNSVPNLSDVKASEAAAQAMGVQLQSLDVTDADTLEKAFLSAVKGRAQALLIPANGFFPSLPKRIVDLAAKARLPAIYSSSQLTLAGGLMSYTSDYGEQFRGAAGYVGRILKGEKPADLPVQQPTKFEFLINLKTAKGLGITIPNSVLVQVTKVIE
jgi:putative ABC transport system substrate-binding protein